MGKANADGDVSVIVRSMGKPLLAKALASVAAQTVPRAAEVVVVSAIGGEHAPLPPRLGHCEVRLVHEGRRLRRPEAANAGLRAARCPRIAFLDDDDELLPEHFAVLGKVLDEKPEVAFVYGQSRLVDGQGREVGVYGEPFVPWRQLAVGHFAVGSFMMRRWIVEQGARFDENLDILEDLEFFVQCARLAKPHFVPRPVHLYHVDAGESGTGGQSPGNREAIRGSLAYIQAKWGDLKRELDATPGARLDRAADLMREDREADALVLLRQVLEAGPADVNALNLAGVALLRLGRTEEAAGMLERAFRILPGHPGIRANLELAKSRLTR